MSPPRGPDCWVLTMYPAPMNMVFQEPKCVITIGIGHDAGFDEVPEARFMRNMLAGFISTMFMLPIAAGGCEVA